MHSKHQPLTKIDNMNPPLDNPTQGQHKQLHHNAGHIALSHRSGCFARAIKTEPSSGHKSQVVTSLPFRKMCSSSECFIDNCVSWTESYYRGWIPRTFDCWKLAKVYLAVVCSGTFYLFID